jgi:hypothetical protein
MQKNKIHIITPFYRKHLLQTIIHYYSSMDIIWHPVSDSKEIKVFDNNNLEWIQPLLCLPLKQGEQCYRKLNDFIDNSKIIDNDYYCFNCDDDMYEPNFFDIIRQQTAKILIVSMVRGNSITYIQGTTNHPTYPLIQKSLEDIRVCNIGLQQYLIKGEILKQMRFSITQDIDDGLFAEELKRKFPNDIKFLSDCFVFFNYFEPGRYTNNDWKIKTCWELPTIII